MNKKILFISLLSSLFLQHNANALSLQETLEQTYKNNETLNAKRYEVKAIRSNKNLAISGFMPDIEININRGESKNEYENSSGSIDRTLDIETDSISLTQPISKSGRTILEVKSRQSTYRAAKGNLLSTEQTIHESAIAAYTEILKQQELLQLSRDREDSLQKSYEYALARFKVGEATKTEVETANARYARATSEKIVAKNDLRQARENFIKIVDTDPKDLETLTLSDYDIKSNNLNIKDEIVRRSLKNNPSLIVAEYNHKSNKFAKRKSKSEFFPELTLNASASEYLGYDFSGNQVIDYDIEETEYYFNLNIPLFQSGTEYFGASKANSEYNQSKYNLMLAKKEVKELAINSYNTLKAAKAVVKSEVANVRAAKLALEAIQEEEKLGLKTIIDVLDSKRDFYDAEEFRIEAEYAQIRSFYQLEVAQGKLTGKALGFEEIKI